MNSCTIFDLCYNNVSTILIPPPRPPGIAPARGALLLRNIQCRFDKLPATGIITVL
jgi:hypothetical protein